jgi:predicted DNA-binding transcriptional regulator YafY
MLSVAAPTMAPWTKRSSPDVNRTDRLYALVEELRARAPRAMRAMELAARFEVSTRTVERDLAALQQAGVPIWAQPGPGGGYFLDPRSTLPPLNLTTDEATAIAVALAAAGSMPFADAGRSALRKLAAVMSPAQLQAAGALTGKVAFADHPPEEARATAAVEEGLRHSRAIELEYEDVQGRVTKRTVEPSALVGGRHGWYLVGYCRLRQAGRPFRLDRILNAHVTAERVTPRAVEDLMDDFPHDLRRPSFGAED